MHDGMSFVKLLVHLAGKIKEEKPESEGGDSSITDSSEENSENSEQEYSLRSEEETLTVKRTAVESSRE